MMPVQKNVEGKGIELNIIIRLQCAVKELKELKTNHENPPNLSTNPNTPSSAVLRQLNSTGGKGESTHTSNTEFEFTNHNKQNS